MTPLAISCLCCICFAGGICAGENSADTTKLPASVNNILDRLTKDIGKNRLAYDDANRKLLDAAEKTLKVEMDRLAKAGNLDEAIALKAVMDGMRTDVVNKVNEAVASIRNDTSTLLVKSDQITRKAQNARFGGDYPDLLWTDGSGGYYEIPINVVRGRYYLYAVMTSGASRPCRILLNNQEVARGFALITGGFTCATTQTDMVGPFAVDGQAILRIEPAGLSPHFLGFAISTSNTFAVSSADFIKTRN